MGTRSVIAVYKDGQFRVGQYSQWDGGPTGQGETIRQFFAEPDFDMQHFRDRIDACEFLNDDQIELVNKKINEKGGFKEAGFAHLSRDMGADILQHIYESEEPVALVDQVAFAGEGLFCEWAYVIDLDKNILEVFKGFNQSPLIEDDRFYFLQDNSPDWTPAYQGQERHYPAKLVATIDLSELPTFDMSSVAEEEEEEDA